MQTIGNLLCLIFKKAGYYLFANQDYMSRVRGGNNFFQVRIASKPLYTLRQNIDIIVALNKASVGLYEKELNQGGIVLLDAEKFGIQDENQHFFNVPFYTLANTIGASDIFTNTICSGVLIMLAGIDFSYLQEELKSTFADKGEVIVNKNIQAAKAGYEFAKTNFKREGFKITGAAPKETLLMTGNDAIALGAIKAGCKFYSAYPMTPSTNIMNAIAHFAPQFNIVVEQAEDEIAAVNMAIGASVAGARSMTGTSGGGFALMVEGLSLAGMTETPIVIVDAQRPAPATGFPTRTEQADLDFLIHAGHGEFARVVYAPGTIEEAFYLTIKAFNIADKYQIPVLLMTDQHLGDSYRNIEALDQNKVKVQRYIISKSDSQGITAYKRYQLNETGISPRAIPSWIKEVFYVDSDEHSEEGHITEDAQIRTKMVEKRFFKKLSALAKEVEAPRAYNLENAEKVLIGFGSTYGVMREAAENSDETGFIHLSQVWPLPILELQALLKNAKNIITVENNAGAQLAKLLKRETGISANSSILKFDGRPFNLEYLTLSLKGTKKNESYRL